MLQRQSRDRHVDAGGSVEIKDSRGIVAVNRELIRSRTCDGQGIGDDQFGPIECDRGRTRGGEARCKRDRVAVTQLGVGEIDRFTQGDSRTIEIRIIDVVQIGIHRQDMLRGARTRIVAVDQ